MNNTTETIQQPKTYPVHENQCWHDGGAIDIWAVLFFGFIIGLATAWVIFD